MSSGILSDNSMANLHAFITYDKKRREKERDELTRAIAGVPVADAVLNRIIWLGPGDCDEVLRRHPGYDADETLSSLWHMLEVFRRSWRDLSRHLDRFNAFAEDPLSLHHSHVAMLDEIQSDVRKEVFCLSSAAMSLVGISQKLEQKVIVPGYRERISDSFVESDEHHFVKELRNNLNHGWFAPADWMMSSGREGRSGTFTFSCAELLYNGSFNARATKFIQSAGERIDVRSLFTSYVDKVEALYKWLASVIEGHLPSSVLDYRRCIKARKANAARCWWRLILQQVAIPRRIDPYQYLDRYLNQEQISDVMKLPHRSAEQVDLIIEMVDEHGACDKELRELVYKLFDLETRVMLSVLED